MGSVVTLSKTVKGFDTTNKLTGTYASCMASSGYGFVGRYVSLSTEDTAVDLSAGEASALTKNGLAIVVAQRGRDGADGSTLGRTDADHALANLHTVGAPLGIIVYADIELYSTVTAAAEYADAWATVINSSAKYKAGYYGNPTVLSRTSATWHSLWENPNNLGTLPSAKIRQGAESTHTCGGTVHRVDADITLETVEGVWGY